jgi:hypothetical protein
MNLKKKISYVSSVLEGFCFYLARPRFWLSSLGFMIFAWFLFFSFFLFVLYSLWPSNQNFSVSYTIKMLEAVGIASACSIGFWIFIFSFASNQIFESLIKKIMIERRVFVHPVSCLTSIKDAFVFFYKTLFWRFFWVIASLVCYFLGPVSLLISQVGLCHLAFIDGCEMTLLLMGVSFSERFLFYKRHHKKVIVSSILFGIISLFFIPSILLWLFWIPGLYIGASFFSMEHYVSKS